MGKDYRVGNIRPSQLIWTYGPGAMIDLPNFSVMTQGLDSWNQDKCTAIEEQRLLAQVQRVCGPQVKKLLQPPVCDANNNAMDDPNSYIGVPVQPFPRWFRCIKCGLLAPYDSGLFTFKDNFYNPEKMRFVHEGCPRSHGRAADVIPVRFLVACKNGHIDEFPWRWFVHRGPSECRGQLSFFEQGGSTLPENLWVECKGCGKKRQMGEAYKLDDLPACRGHHPHLGYDEHCYSKCDEQLRPILLGATNSWFPLSISVLAIPTRESALAQVVCDNWEALKGVESEVILKALFTVWINTHERSELRQYPIDEVWKAIQKERTGKKDVVTDEDVKAPEWVELTSKEHNNKFPQFVCRDGDVPKGFEGVIEKVVLLEKLRKVNALVGFTRIEARDEFADEIVKPAPLSRRRPEFVPACEVFGEGIFIQFKEKVISKWEAGKLVKKHEAGLKNAYGAWRVSRKLKAEGFPGARYYMLHTLAHLFIRELALECGYNAASIQERIYAQAGEKPMAGILVYTAAADSDGTLGGLVSLGEAKKLEGILKKALRRALTCSSDPLCSDHESAKDGSLHGAACHACSFLAETSCEVGNRYLDRTLVVPTYGEKEVAFFAEVLNHE
jgi:hypothetical protein